MKIIYFLGSKAFFFGPSWGSSDLFCGLLFTWKYAGLKWKRVQNAVRGCSLKNNRMMSLHFQGNPFNITVIQVWAPTSNAKEAEVEQFYEDPEDLLELTAKKDAIHHWGLECKSSKSRDT